MIRVEYTCLEPLLTSVPQTPQMSTGYQRRAGLGRSRLTLEQELIIADGGDGDLPDVELSGLPSAVRSQPAACGTHSAVVERVHFSGDGHGGYIGSWDQWGLGQITVCLYRVCDAGGRAGGEMRAGAVLASSGPPAWGSVTEGGRSRPEPG